MQSEDIDSIQVIKASRLLCAGLAVALGYNIDAAALTTRAVYGNPSPRQLAHYVMQTIERGGNTNGVNGVPMEVDPEEQQQHVMKVLHDKYTENLLRPNSPAARRPEASDTDQTVILTGSTGMLGTYMLDAMALRKIICLNRPDDGDAAKQATSMRERGLEVGYGGKAKFHQIDAPQPDLGLSKDAYA
ncbi:hypothetical protein PG989_000063 [Apiospora arundinis]